MKYVLFSVLSFLTINQSLAQSSIPDTSNHTDQIQIRGQRGDSTFYYIDGIKVRKTANVTGTRIEDIFIITGGIPIIYGDLNSSMFRISPTPDPAIKHKTCEKEQNLVTE
ncbi:hypothetical protein [Fluviicola chungangensis]|uniref:TonB-dependent receptor plug domain-containing protein n=1 Tax=Fluviicola chungangensis TaxID=2597671 RepID=A0A556MJK9_9FLAO|nr:hypothetical protein [Fluviicola chungangensis]TSJ40090.1 hypothetical protein FO442_15950 [Fluviicola chungangensis]